MSLCLAIGIGSEAHATIGCSVIAETEGALHVPLFQAPDANSEVLRDVPVGDMVFYPDDDLAPRKAEGWTWVRHDVTQEDIWHSGIHGWMLRSTLSLCG